MSPAVSGTKGGTVLTLHVQPGAARSELAGLHGDALKLRIAAPPVDGAANDAVVEFLADRLGVRRQAVQLVAGWAGRRKRVAIEGLAPRAVARALGL